MWTDVRASIVARGRSVSIADMVSDDSVDAMAQRSVAVLERPTVLAGFSMGGIVALRMHALRPELVAGLVLVSSNARPDMPERSSARFDHQRRAKSGQLGELVATDMIPAYFATAHPHIAQLQLSAIRMMNELGPEVFVKQSEAIRTRPDSRAELENIRCPCLIIGGAHDTLSPPAWQHELAQGIGSSELVIVEKAAHFVPLEAGAELIDALTSWAARHDL